MIGFNKRIKALEIAIADLSGELTLGPENDRADLLGPINNDDINAGAEITPLDVTKVTYILASFINDDTVPRRATLGSYNGNSYSEVTLNQYEHCTLSLFLAAGETYCVFGNAGNQDLQVNKLIERSLG